MRKIIFIVMLVLGMASLASADISLNDSLGPSFETFNIGDYICYEISLAVDEGDTDLVDVNVWFFDPCNLPAGGNACDSGEATAGGVLIAEGLTIINGEPAIEINCFDEAALLHLVTLDNLTDADGNEIFAYIATTWRAAGTSLADCDPKPSLNYVNPPGADIDVIKVADPNELCEGDPCTVTYTYYVTSGDSVAPLVDVQLTDTDCSPVTYDSGDFEPFDQLDIGETWVFECITDVLTTTTNIVTAEANDIFGQYVWDTAEATVTINPPPEVSIDPCDVDICEGDNHEFCAVASGGTPPYSYQWTKMPSTPAGTTQCITVSDDGEYCVVVTDDNGCMNFACATLTVIPDPPCDIEGPSPVCENDVNEYCGPADVDSWSWSIVGGNATFEGPNDTECVDVNVGTEDFTLQLTTTNENDVICSSECELPVDVEPCDDVNGCTPGFWKNNARQHDSSAWVNYSKGDKFSAVFGRTIEIRLRKKGKITDPTLIQALSATGGCLNALARHSVAALLNISGGCGSYPIDESTLISDVQAAIDSGECRGLIRSTKNELAEYNEEGCGFNMQGECQVN
ncbi:MAG: hypothetical protein ACYSUK_05920 [Planctomycetota bacterium]|jgi:hypothetical protein